MAFPVILLPSLSKWVTGDAAGRGAKAEDVIVAGRPATAPASSRPRRQATGPGQALACAAEELHGAAATGSPAGPARARNTGYTVAGYLIQHASGERRYARGPASSWDAAARARASPCPDPGERSPGYAPPAPSPGSVSARRRSLCRSVPVHPGDRAGRLKPAPQPSVPSTRTQVAARYHPPHRRLDRFAPLPAR